MMTMRLLILILLPFTCPGQFVLPAAAPLESSFYVTDVIDDRKDPLNNGLITESGKKIPAVFEGGIAAQLKTFSGDMMQYGPGKLPVVLQIRKLVLSERMAGSSRVCKVDLTLEFLRRDHGVLTKLVELSTWMEQGSGKNAKPLHDKIIADILKKMFGQFDELVKKQTDDPLFAHEIEFRVTSKQTVKEETDTIYWSQERKLTWADFKGEPKGTYYAALSNCAFAQSIEPVMENGKGIIYIYVRAALLKKGSWVRSAQATDEVLQHEQLHFDIAEWQVRRLRKAISEAKLTLDNYESLIDQLTDAAWAEYNKIQSDYDLETRHGINDPEQQKWNKTVAENLSLLQDFN
jgi:hypothetical protein